MTFDSPLRVVTTEKGRQWHLSANGFRTYCGRPVLEVLGAPGEVITARGDGSRIELHASCHNCR
jgi:hypothetical protein